MIDIIKKFHITNLITIQLLSCQKILDRKKRQSQEMLFLLSGFKRAENLPREDHWNVRRANGI